MPLSLTPRRRLLAAVALAACAATALTLTPRDDARAAAGDCTPAASWGTERADLASQVVSLVNQHRSGIGLVSLQVSPTLTRVAVWKARHMAAYGYMSHDDPAPPIARTTAQRFADCGWPTSAGWGENIAYGYSTASAVMNGWLNSSGHRANIERSTFRAIGVGAAANGSGTLYWAQAFGTSTFDAGGGGGPTSPSVSLTSTPSPETTSTSASFGWSTSGSPTSTTCSIDGAAAVACTSPRSYSGLAVGGHTFRVTVANSAGSASALHSWSVTSAGGGGTGAPTVTITQRPARVSSSTAATFAWTTGGAVTSTTCSLDNAVATPCSSPKSYSGMSRTSHSFRVTVSGPSGSRSKTVSWRIS